MKRLYRERKVMSTTAKIVLFLMILLSFSGRAFGQQPTIEDYRWFSQTAYQEHFQNRLNYKDWIFIDATSEDDANDAYGLFAMAYINQNKRHIIIAFRGTDQAFLPNIPVDVIPDIQFATDQMPNQFKNSAVPFIERILKLRKVIGNDYQISFTGHSLGGGLAQLSAAWMLCQKGELSASFTFDNPGTRKLIVEQICQGKNICSFKPVAFVRTPNVVNTATEHIGTIFALGEDWRQIYTQFPHGEANSVDDIGKYLAYSLATHNLAQSGVPLTGDTWLFDIHTTWVDVTSLWYSAWVKASQQTFDIPNTSLTPRGALAGYSYWLKGWMDISMLEPPSQCTQADMPTPLPPAPSEVLNHPAGLLFIWQNDVHYAFNFVNVVNIPNSVNITANYAFEERWALWSPDGTRFISAANGLVNGTPLNLASIYQLNADGQVLQKWDVVDQTSGIGTDSIGLYLPAWSGDGAILAFVYNGNLYTMNADTSQLSVWRDTMRGSLPRFYGLWQPQWLGDERWLLMESVFPDTVAGRASIAEGRSGTLSQTPINFYFSARSQAIVSPTREHLLTVLYPEDNDRNALMHVYALNPRMSDGIVLLNGANISHPAWSPQGDKVAFASNSDESGKIRIVHLDGQSVDVLHPPMRVVATPMWLNETSLIFRGIPSDTASLAMNIYQVNLSSGVLEILAENIGEAWGDLPRPFALDPCKEYLAYHITYMEDVDALRTALMVRHLSSGQESIVFTQDGSEGAKEMSFRPRACVGASPLGN